MKSEAQTQAIMRFADDEILQELIRLTPLYIVSVKEGEDGPVCSYVPSLVTQMFAKALREGWTIDRTNGDDPLVEWDGWLKIETPDKSLFIRIAEKGGEKLT